jgi:hypothetical protein
MYPLTTSLVRLSIGVFLLRIAVTRWHRLTLIIVTFCATLYSVFFFFFILFQCHPIEHYWTRVTDPDSLKNGACALGSSELGVSYVHSAVSAVADWTYGLLPVAMVWSLKMKRGTKVLIALLLGMGAVGSAAVIVRIPYIRQLASTEDYLYRTSDLAIWSVIEPGIGITAGSIATLRPLFRIGTNAVRKARGVPTVEGSWTKKTRTYFEMSESSCSTCGKRVSINTLKPHKNSLVSCPTHTSWIPAHGGGGRALKGSALEAISIQDIDAFDFAAPRSTTTTVISAGGPTLSDSRNSKGNAQHPGGPEGVVVETSFSTDEIRRASEDMV